LRIDTENKADSDDELEYRCEDRDPRALTDDEKINVGEFFALLPVGPREQEKHDTRRDAQKVRRKRGEE